MWLISLLMTWMTNVSLTDASPLVASKEQTPLSDTFRRTSFSSLLQLRKIKHKQNTNYKLPVNRKFYFMLTSQTKTCQMEWRRFCLITQQLTYHNYIKIHLNSVYIAFHLQQVLRADYHYSVFASTCLSNMLWPWSLDMPKLYLPAIPCSQIL